MADDNRTIKITIRMNAKEKDQLYKLAIDQRKSASAVIRDLVFAASKKKKR